jgi:NAD(P)-dependent dehydrogenase (short-subunit alcohol dehydrogenase family)
MGNLDGKAVIVTGAGKGLGRAYARAIGAEGGMVVVNDINAESAEATTTEIAAAGGMAVACVADVARMADAGRLIDSCLSAFGRIDVLLNNAGLPWGTPILEETEEGYRHFLDVNVSGTFNTVHQALPHLVAQRSGSIVNVTSGAHHGFYGMAVYSLTKGAVASFTYALAFELAEYNIRVNAIEPRGLDTPRNATHPVPHADVVAPLAVFLCSDASARVTGQVIRLDNQDLSLVTHPQVGKTVVLPTGWTFDAIREHWDRTLGRELEPVGLYASRYAYYDGLEAAQPPAELWRTQINDRYGSPSS